MNTVIDAVEPDRAGAREGLEAFALAMFGYARGHPTLQFRAADVARVIEGVLYSLEWRLESDRPDDEGA